MCTFGNPDVYQSLLNADHAYPVLSVRVMNGGLGIKPRQAGENVGVLSAVEISSLTQNAAYFSRALALDEVRDRLARIVIKAVDV